MNVDSFIYMIANLLFWFISIFYILNGTIYALLRQSNSKSQIKEAKFSANFWNRISSLCFWNIKSSRLLLIRFFIGIRILGLIFCLISLLVNLLCCFVPSLEIFQNCLLYVCILYNGLITTVVAIYTIHLFNK